MNLSNEVLNIDFGQETGQIKEVKFGLQMFFVKIQTGIKTFLQFLQKKKKFGSMIAAFEPQL